MFIHFIIHAAYEKARRSIKKKTHGIWKLVHLRQSSSISNFGTYFKMPAPAKLMKISTSTNNDYSREIFYGAAFSLQFSEMSRHYVTIGIKVGILGAKQCFFLKISSMYISSYLNDLFSNVLSI